MIVLHIIQVTLWFFVGFPFLLVRDTVLPPARALLNIPLNRFLLLLTLDIWAKIFHLLSQITRESLKLLFVAINSCLMLMALAPRHYPGTLTYTRYIPAILTIERNIFATWLTVFLTMNYIGLSSDGEVWRMMRHLRGNYYGLLIDCAAACGWGMWVAGCFKEWAGVVLYAALAIVDVYQLDWVGDEEGRLAERDRLEVWGWCARVIQDWRVWVEAQAVSGGGGENLRDVGRDTRTGRVPPAPGPRPEDSESAVTPEPITSEATSTPLETSNIQTEPQVVDTPDGDISSQASSTYQGLRFTSSIYQE
ncbi:hypothetical protein HOY82DRAFT_626047 [Tuber indicum]|nr:hypothetical protein HOY82DRAFT_626047 [Tuber indicum]